MVGSPNGHLLVPVHLRVAMGWSIAAERAPILHQPMVAKHVQGQLWTLNLVKRKNAQVKEFLCDKHLLHAGFFKVEESFLYGDILQQQNPPQCSTITLFQLRTSKARCQNMSTYKSCNFFQLMACLHLGHHTPIVQKHVAMEVKPVRVPAQILHPLMVDKSAVVQQLSANHATYVNVLVSSSYYSWHEIIFFWSTVFVDIKLNFKGLSHK